MRRFNFRPFRTAIAVLLLSGLPLSVLASTVTAPPPAATGYPVNDTIALQAAVDACKPQDTLMIPSGTYRMLTTLYVNKVLHVEANGAELRAVAPTPLPTLVQIGNDAAGWSAVLQGGTIRGLRIFQNTLNWTAGTGILFVNCQQWELTGVQMYRFATGIEVKGNGAGCAYNSLRFKGVVDCKIGLKTTTANGGYVSETTIYDGKWSYNAGNVGGTHLYLGVASSSDACGGLRFENCSFEGLDANTTVANIINGGRYFFFCCRYESYAPHPAMAIKLAPSVYRVLIVGSTTWNAVVQGQSPQYTLVSCQ